MPDLFDFRLLAALQEDARLPMSALAERVGLSEPACYRRIRMLRETGAIERDVALVAPRTMGWPMTMLVLLTLQSDRSRIVEEVVGRLRRAPEVIDVWYVTGDHDLVLHMAAEDMAGYEAFIERVLHADDSIRSFKTLVVLRHAKKAAALPAAAGDARLR